MLKHPTLDLLHALGLHGMAKAFTELDASSEAEGLGHREWLGLLLDREKSWRQDKRLTARLRVDKEQAHVEHSMRKHRLKNGPAVSLSTTTPADIAMEAASGPLSPASASANWPASVDKNVNAFVDHWLLMHGGSREGVEGREAAAEAAELLRLGRSPAAIDAVLASAERGAAREAAEHAGGGAGGGRGGSAPSHDGGGAGGRNSKAKSPTPPSPAKKEKTPPPPCPITEQIVASAIAAGADPKRVQESLEAFPGTTAKAIVNKTLLHLGRRGATVGEVLSTANALQLTEPHPWDEASKGKRTHVSTMLSSGGKFTSGRGEEGGGGGASGDGGVGGGDGGGGDASAAASQHFTPFFVHVGQRKNAHVYAHSAYPGLVSAADQAKAAAATAAANAANANAGGGAAAGGGGGGGGSSRPSSSSRGATPTPTPAAAAAASNSGGGGGGSVANFAAQLQSVSAVLADRGATPLEKAAAIKAVPVAVIERLGEMNPAFKPLLEALAKIGGGGGSGGGGGGGGSAAKEGGGGSGGKAKGKK